MCTRWRECRCWSSNLSKLFFRSRYSHWLIGGASFLSGVTVPDEEIESGTWIGTDFGVLEVFEDLEGLADLVLEDLEGLVAAAAAASSTTGGVATVRLVPTAMLMVLGQV